MVCFSQKKCILAKCMKTINARACILRGTGQIYLVYLLHDFCQNMGVRHFQIKGFKNDPLPGLFWYLSLVLAHLSGVYYGKLNILSLTPHKQQKNGSQVFVSPNLSFSLLLSGVLVYLCQYVSQYQLHHHIFGCIQIGHNTSTVTQIPQKIGTPIFAKQMIG